MAGGLVVGLDDDSKRTLQNFIEKEDVIILQS